MGVLRDLLIEASSDAGIPISDKNFIKWYNMAASRIALTYNTGKKSDKQTIICTDPKAEYTLTSGCIGIERVLDANGYNFINYVVRDNSIVLFGCEGTFTFHLQLMPAAIANLDGAMTVPDVYRNAIKYFIVSSALKAHSQDKAIRTDAADNMDMFTLEANSANNAIRGVTNKYKQVAVRRFR